MAETGAAHPLNDRLQRGMETLCRIERTDRPGVLDGFSDLAPGLGELVVEFAFGDICSRPQLELRTRQLLTVSALTALGNAAPQLEFHVRGARNVGCSRREIVEAMTHLCLYAGFPATINALQVARSVFEAEADGAGDAEADGNNAAAATAGAAETTGAEADDRYARGMRMLERVDGHGGVAVVDSMRQISPDLARYLVEFAFGDIYCRDGLDLRTRELVTVAALTAMGTARPQLKVHLHGLLNVGGTEQDAVETIIQMAVYAGFPSAINGLNVAREVFQER